MRKKIWTDLEAAIEEADFLAVDEGVQHCIIQISGSEMSIITAREAKHCPVLYRTGSFDPKKMAWEGYSIKRVKALLGKVSIDEIVKDTSIPAKAIIAFARKHRIKTKENNDESNYLGDNDVI